MLENAWLAYGRIRLDLAMHDGYLLGILGMLAAIFFVQPVYLHRDVAVTLVLNLCCPFYYHAVV